MSDCGSNLSKAFIKVCGHRPKQGVVGKWYVNWDDIDRGATQLANKGTTITTLVLKAGKKIFEAEGTDKTSSAKHALVTGDLFDGYKITDSYTILYKGSDQKERVQELVDGARVVSIYKKVDTGIAGETAFEVGGYESGLKIINDDYDTSANSGTTTIVVETKPGEEESTGIKTFYDTDLATTEAWIATNLYVAP